MSKLLNYLSILATILIVAHILGLIEDTGTTTILNWLAHPETFNLSLIFSETEDTFTLLGIGTVGAITAGLILSQRYDLAMMVPIAGVFLLVAGDILAIYLGLKDINPEVAVLIVSPLLLIYVLSVIEWWRGVN